MGRYAHGTVGPGATRRSREIEAGPRHVLGGPRDEDWRRRAHNVTTRARRVEVRPPWGRQGALAPGGRWGRYTQHTTVQGSALRRTSLRLDGVGSITGLRGPVPPWVFITPRLRFPGKPGTLKQCHPLQPAPARALSLVHVQV